MLINSIDIKRPPIISKTTPININQNSISQPKNMGVLSFEGFLPFFSKPNNINKESLFVQKSYTHIPNSENEKSSRKNDLNFDIKNIVRSIRDEYANFDLEAKQSTKQLHKLINYGKKYNYKGSIPWGYNTNLTFPDYKDNKVKTIIVWKNGSPHEIFEINSLKPKPDYELTMYAGTSTLTYTIKDGQITSAFGINKDDNSKTLIEANDTGFSSKIYDLDNTTQDPDVIIEFNNQDIDKCSVTIDAEGVKTLFKYNPENDLWEEQWQEFSYFVDEKENLLDNPCYIPRKNAQNLSKEEQESEEIKEELRTIVGIIQDYQNITQDAIKNLTGLLELYQNNPNAKKLQGEDLEFEFLEFENDNLLTIKVSQNGELIAQHSIKSFTPDFEFSYTLNSNDVETTYDIKNDRLTSFVQKHKDDDIKKHFRMDENGYTYIYEQNNEIILSLSVLKGLPPTYYSNFDNTENTFIYNQALDLWQKVE